MSQVTLLISAVSNELADDPTLFAAPGARVSARGESPLLRSQGERFHNRAMFETAVESSRE